ncbi:MAG: ArsR/SmtB family transcription factor [Thermomicrobiales bacterium]
MNERVDAKNETKPRQQVARVIDDPETLRLIADPLRLRVLELLRQEPRTVTELADLLDVQRTKLYYHVKLLEAHDLIVVDETRLVSGITEKRYRVTAYRLSVDKTMLGSPDSGDAPLDVYLSMVLDEVATEIRRSVRSGLIDLEFTHEDVIAPRRVMIGRQWFLLADEDVTRFQERYVEALTEFEAKRVSYPDATGDPVEGDGAVLYEWLTAFYPVVPPEDGGER